MRTASAFAGSGKSLRILNALAVALGGCGQQNRAANQKIDKNQPCAHNEVVLERCVL
jgi:hypothetical protein